MISVTDLPSFHVRPSSTEEVWVLAWWLELCAPNVGGHRFEPWLGN